MKKDMFGHYSIKKISFWLNPAWKSKDCWYLFKRDIFRGYTIEKSTIYKRITCRLGRLLIAYTWEVKQ